MDINNYLYSTCEFLHNLHVLNYKNILFIHTRYKLLNYLYSFSFLLFLSHTGNVQGLVLAFQEDHMKYRRLNQVSYV